MDVKEIG